MSDGIEDHPDRPRTRGECIDGPRPCPWYACRYHLGVDIGLDGSIRVRIPPEDLEHHDGPTCALDVADAGGNTFDVLGELLGISRQRARQIAAPAYALLRQSEDLCELAGRSDAQVVPADASKTTRRLIETRLGVGVRPPSAAAATDFGAEVQRLAEAAGSQTALARAWGVSSSAISGWIRGVATPRIMHWAALARAGDTVLRLAAECSVRAASGTGPRSDVLIEAWVRGISARDLRSMDGCRWMCRVDEPTEEQYANALRAIEAYDAS